MPARGLRVSKRNLNPNWENRMNGELQTLTNICNTPKYNCKGDAKNNFREEEITRTYVKMMSQSQCL